MVRRAATTAGLAGVVVVVLATSVTTAVVRSASHEPAPAVIAAAPPPPPLQQPVVTKPLVPAKPKAAPSACPVASPVSPAIARGAHALGSSVEVYASPAATRPLRSLRSPTRDWQRLVLGVREVRGEWLLVQYNERPNGVTGWIKASQVVQTTTPYRIVVERCAKRLTLYRNGTVVMREPVAVGTPRTPTPLGEFYVDFIEKKSNPRGSYGPYMLSVSGFSEVYMRFGKGGVGQIAIHGTNARSSVGRAASNGCIRMHNEAVSKLAYLVIAGTPVSIVA